MEIGNPEISGRKSMGNWGYVTPFTTNWWAHPEGELENPMADYDLIYLDLLKVTFQRILLRHLKQFQALFRFAVDGQDLANLVGILDL